MMQPLRGNRSRGIATLNRDGAEYILSTFKGFHERTPLFAEKHSTAEQILALYDEYGK